MKQTLFGFACLATLSFSAKAQLPDSLKKHLDTAFSIMQEHSYYSKKVDWRSEKAIAYRNASGVTTREGLFPVIAAAFKKLEDHHGWFEQYNDKIKLDVSNAVPPSENMLKEWAKGPKIIAKMLGNVAYLRIPGMPAYNQKGIDLYANWLTDSLVSLATKKPKAWIIDLRLNTGGNIIPMMGPFSAFFPEGVISYYMDRDKKIVTTAEKRKGIFYQDDTVHANIRQPLPGLHRVAVAVIIGSGTGSSGEGVAHNFKERKNTRLFGEATAGVANATQGFIFNEEQSYFLLTTAIIANKKKKAFPEIVVPDALVKHNDLFENVSGDNAVMAAMKWLDGNKK